MTKYEIIVWIIVGTFFVIAGILFFAGREP